MSLQRSRGGHNRQPPPPRPLEQPWRHIGRKGQPVTWNEEMENALREKCLRPGLELPEREQVRILMLGPSGSGKSAFINSLYGALPDDLRQYTFASSGATRVTSKIFNPPLRIGGKNPYFRILDSPGLIETDDEFNKAYVRYALGGHLKENVEYGPPEIPRDGKHFVAKPGRLDRPCLVVFVMKPQPMLPDCAIMQKLQMAKDLANCNEIKLAVVVPWADFVEERPLKNKDVQYIFSSTAVQKLVTITSKDTGLPLNLIFPVTNYTDQTETCTEMNIVLLYTLSKLLDNAKLEAERRLAERGQEEEDN